MGFISEAHSKAWSRAVAQTNCCVSANDYSMSHSLPGPLFNFSKIIQSLAKSFCCQITNPRLGHSHIGWIVFCQNKLILN